MKNNSVNLDFIVGMSRSGTTWVMKALNQHSKVTAFGETCFFGRNAIGKPTYNYNDLDWIRKRLTTLDDNNKVCNKNGGLSLALEKSLGVYDKADQNIPKEDIFTNFIKQISLCAQTPNVIEKTPHHINHFEEIIRYYPDSKFLVCYRDAPGFLLSYKHQGDRKETKVKRNFKRSFHPYFALKVYNKFESQVNKLKLKEFAYLIEFERIQTEPDQLLKEIQSFLSLPYENISLKKTNSSFTNEIKPKLKLEDKIWLNRLTGSNFKFNHKEQILIPLFWVFSFFKLILAGTFVALIMSKTVKAKRIIPHIATYFKN